MIIVIRTWSHMENKLREKLFSMRSKDQKNTPVNVSTYDRQTRDNEKNENANYLSCCQKRLVEIARKQVKGDTGNFFCG